MLPVMKQMLRCEVQSTVISKISLRLNADRKLLTPFTPRHALQPPPQAELVYPGLPRTRLLNEQAKPSYTIC